MALLIGALASPAFAFQYISMSLSEMTVVADVITIGSLREVNRPGGSFGTLRVEEVLHGEGIRSGETLELEIQKMMAIPESPSTNRAIVWLRRGPQGFGPVNFSNSVRPVDKKTLAAIRADLAFLRDPLAAMAAMSVPAAPVLNAWIERKWVPSDAKPTDDERRIVIAFLLRVAKVAADADRAKAMELLGALRAPAAYDVFVEALVSCPFPCNRAALKGLERLGDPRAVPALKRFLATNPHLREEVLHVLGTLSDAKSVP